MRVQRAINRDLLGDVVGERARLRERRALEGVLSCARLRLLDRAGYAVLVYLNKGDS